MSKLINAEFGEYLKPIPVISRVPEYWPIDNSWFSPSIEIADNHWLITWSKNEDRIKTDRFEYVPVKSPLNVSKSPVLVKHAAYGDGVAHASDGDNLLVDFADIGSKSLHWSDLQKQEPVYEKTKLTNPIKRLIVIAINGRSGRVISTEEKNYKFKIITDLRGDKTTLNEIVKVMASIDNMAPLLKTAAKWRTNPASDKQKQLISSRINYPDIKNLTSGEASALIDQIFWKKTIVEFFGNE